MGKFKEYSKNTVCTCTLQPHYLIKAICMEMKCNGLWTSIIKQHLFQTYIQTKENLTFKSYLDTNPANLEKEKKAPFITHYCCFSDTNELSEI